MTICQLNISITHVTLVYSLVLPAVMPCSDTVVVAGVIVRVCSGQMPRAERTLLAVSAGSAMVAGSAVAAALAEVAGSADFVGEADDDTGDVDSRAGGGEVSSERGSASLPPLLSSLLLLHLCS